MFRARPVGILLVSIGIVLMSFGVSTPVAPRDPPPTVGALEPAAVVGWPPSTALLLAEVVTGGGSASDEFVEIVNVGAVPLDLNGIELAYASAAGTSATRKILWSISRVLDPGRRLLAANVSGIFASVADATWSGGIAATGGTVVLRSVGGTVIDAAGWGDATNAWVEGSAAAAPPAGSSIERRPGGDLGNAADSNDNAADWFVQAAPIAQGLNTPPQPTPTPTPTLAPTASPTPTPTATATPTATPTAAPTATPTPPPTVEPTTAPTSDPTLAPSPTPEPTPEPTIEPTPEPTPTFEPTPEPTIEPTPEPTFEPTPEPTAPPTPDATLEPTPEPTPEPTVMPTPAPTPDPTNEPSPTPEATASPSLEPSPTPFPSPTPSVMPSPTPEPTPSPSPSPSPVVTIGAARVLADGVTVTIEAVLTTPLGALESGRGAFVQDETAGIALYLDGATSLAYPPGVVVRATGILGTRFGQRVIRLAQADIAAIASDELPTPVSLTTGEIGEDEEGRRIATEGHVGAAPDSVTDGVAIDLDDGSGSIRVVIATSAIPSGLVKGALVHVTGPVGQRDSGSGGGYRIHVTTPGEIEVVAPPPTPTPKPTATPKPSATPSPSATPKATAAPKPSEAPKPTATAKPSATPKPTSSPKPTATPVAAISIASARGAEAGTVVRVAGVVTIAPGGLGSLDLVAIQDDTAGIVVKLHTPEYLVPGTRIEVTGPLGQPYGQLEVRPDQDGWRTLGTAPMPVPLDLSAYPGEGEEARIVTLEVVVEGSVSRGENGDFSVPVAFDGSSLSVRADGTSGVSAGEFRRGATLRLTGVIGQRASATGRADGYRLWLRLPADVEVRSPGPSASVRPGSSPGATRRPGSTAKPRPPSVKTIGRAVTSGGDVTVEGTVTTPPALLDGDGRTIVIQDRSGAVAVRVPAGTSVSVNDRVRVVGEVGRAYGAPRIVADEVTGLGRGTSPAPIIVKDVPTAALEWRLASVTGTVDRVTRDGDRWRAEIAVGSKRIPVDGLASSGIPASTIVKGGRITLTGIVRRPHPSAADRRFAIAPRSAADVHVTAAASTGGAAASPRTSTGQGSGTARASGAASPTRLLAPGTTLEIAESALAVVDVEFASLATAIGRNVRVGGLVVEVRLDAVVVDDGSAQGLILVAPDAASVLGVLQPGDALNAVGTVVADPELAVRVLDPAGLVPVSAVAPIEDGSADVSPDAAAADAPATNSGAREDVGLTKAPDAKPAPRPMEVALFGLGLASAGAVLLAVVRRRRPAEATAGGPSEQG